MHRQLCTGHSQMVIQCLVVTLPAADTSYQMGTDVGQGAQNQLLDTPGLLANNLLQ